MIRISSRYSDAGLIIKEQDFHLFNESFRQFVRSADQLSFVIEQDKQTQQGSLWQSLKVPVLVGVLAIAAFLFLTQQDLFSAFDCSSDWPYDANSGVV